MKLGFNVYVTSTMHRGVGSFYSMYIGIFGLDKVYSSLSAGLRHSLDHLEHKKMFM